MSALSFRRAKHPASMTSEERDAARYRPAGFVARHLPDGVSTVYCGTLGASTVAYAYIGKSVSTRGYSFGSEAARDAYVERVAASVVATAKARATRAAERKAAGHDLKVGDILSTCWGYEQTNREYYQVTRASGKSVWVRQVASLREHTQPDAGHAVPAPDRFIGEETGPHRARGESATCGYNGATKVPCVEVGGVKSYQPQYWSSYA